MPALAFVSTPEGKLTFRRDPKTRDYIRDNTHVYAVCRTVAMHKGGYYFDATGKAGTLLYQVTTDRLATKSRIIAHVFDGIRQCEAAALILAGTVDAERRRVGAWRILLSWKTLDARSASAWLEA